MNVEGRTRIKRFNELWRKLTAEVCPKIHGTGSYPVNVVYERPVARPGLTGRGRVDLREEGPIGPGSTSFRVIKILGSGPCFSPISVSSVDLILGNPHISVITQLGQLEAALRS